MNCPKCDKELLIDRVDENGKYWYVCMDKACNEYKSSFNPGSEEITPATITDVAKEK